MADEKYTFGTARIRLEEIAAEARKKDTSLEKSLDLLEEGVRLANICTELVDHTDMSPQAADADEGVGTECIGPETVDPEAEAEGTDTAVEAGVEDEATDHAG
ncbi:MAG: exodeoxyribonuclease VII small subunit [Coriobacteriia bacterium]|nr:exodeoxyribonuclease VII small subunit [Coriobacteriia bacterium]